MVLAILAVLAVISAPRFADAMTSYRVQAAARRIAADIRAARIRAETENTTQEIVFNIATDSYELPGMADLDHSLNTYQVNLANKPYKAVLVIANFGGDQTVKFNGFGVPDSGGTIEVSIGSVQKTISLNPDTGNTVLQ